VITWSITADELAHPRIVDRLASALDAGGLAPQQLRLRLAGDLPLDLATPLLGGAASVRELGVVIDAHADR
jgi:hypothetical protein